MVRELSDLILRRRAKDEGLGLVSVTGVNVTLQFPGEDAYDLSAAVVFVSPFGGEQENRETFRSLLRNASYFQSAMSRNLRLRQTPRIRFEIDDSIRKGDALLEKMEEA